MLGLVAESTFLERLVGRVELLNVAAQLAAKMRTHELLPMPGGPDIAGPSHSASVRLPTFARVAASLSS